ncbi:unnamed protein product [Plutella xylostella]|uniref:(diamondback moth) hypothetical protein n=1 Tax=Plutella xylostella TaxID=51655 RepID=A0A8S4G6P4_PLUXY|nr:unnamed protein product [Plutella xylostella]
MDIYIYVHIIIKICGHISHTAIQPQARKADTSRRRPEHKYLPLPGIEPMTFDVADRITNHYITSAIHCFYCNSANNSACADVMALEPELRARIIPAVHCETAVPAPATERFFCRKIVQTSK